MKKIIIFFLLVIFIFNIYSKDNWQIKKDKDQITVYTQDIPNSDFDEFKGVTIFDCGIEVLIALSRDIPGQVNWLFNCSESKLIKKINKDAYIIYTVTKSPWPVKDRDAIWKREYINNLNDGEYLIKFNDIDYEEFPANDNYVRMTDASGYFKFKIIDKDHTEVTYQYRGNPGGKIPPKLSNAASVDFPYKTLVNMKEMVKNEKYINLSKDTPHKKEIENYLAGKNY
jgi:hypothetical protein